ncbi:hypothetical protein G5I_10437, partial [Acromyrmex echinatior]
LSMDDFYKKQEESKVVSLEETQNIMKTVIYKYHKIYSETVRTNDAYGRVIAEDIYSSVNVPRCCVSTKHGYAVLASDGQGVRKVLVHTKHELHSRPKFSWTTLRWMETERFSRACCLQNQNIISYQKGNALLKLPSCSPNQSILEAAFVPAMFLKNL